MTEQIANLIYKTKDSIRGAKALINEGLFDFAASRCYYAMFYATEALLLTRGLSFSSHRAAISGFAREFIKSGTIEKKFHKFLVDAFDKRQVGDYGISEHIEETEAVELVNRAEEFLDMATDYLRKEESGEG